MLRGNRMHERDRANECMDFGVCVFVVCVSLMFSCGSRLSLVIHRRICGRLCVEYASLCFVCLCACLCWFDDIGRLCVDGAVSFSSNSTCIKSGRKAIAVRARNMLFAMCVYACVPANKHTNVHVRQMTMRVFSFSWAMCVQHRASIEKIIFSWNCTERNEMKEIKILARQANTNAHTLSRHIQKGKIDHSQVVC